MRKQENLTSTEQVAAMTPSTGLSENGSNARSGRRMKSGFNKYLQDKQRIKFESGHNCSGQHKRSTHVWSVVKEFYRTFLLSPSFDAKNHRSHG